MSDHLICFYECCHPCFPEYLLPVLVHDLKHVRKSDATTAVHVCACVCVCVCECLCVYVCGVCVCVSTSTETSDRQPDQITLLTWIKGKVKLPN